MSVKITDIPEIRLAALEHHGSPQLIDQTIRKLVQWRMQNDLSPATNATFNLLYNDPEQTTPENFRIDICVATAMDLSDNTIGLKEKIIPEGRCACIVHDGSEDTLAQSIHYLIAEWLPQSGETVRDFPMFLRRYPELPADKAMIEIYLPLQ